MILNKLLRLTMSWGEALLLLPAAAAPAPQWPWGSWPPMTMVRFRVASLMFLCLSHKPASHTLLPKLPRALQGKLLPAALLGLGEEGMATALLLQGALQGVLRNSPEWSWSPGLLAKMAVRVATSGQMLAARFHRLRGKHPLAARMGGGVCAKGGERTTPTMKRS